MYLNRGVNYYNLRWETICFSLHLSTLHLAPTVSESQILQSGILYLQLTGCVLAICYHLKIHHMYFQHAFQPT